MNLPTIRRVIRFVAIASGLACLNLILEHGAQAQNQCAIQASLTNPLATTPPGKGTGEIGAIGGTGMIAAKPGVGGTGVTDGGIGGTGIVGMITGFASICVNGAEVFFDENTPVLDNEQPGSARQLALGQVVVVQSQGVGTELSARRITVIHAVVGPVQFIDKARGEVSVLGQTIKRLTGDELTDLQAGHWVAVSGFRKAQGDIAASRVERISARAQVQLLGTVTRSDRESIIVNGTRVRLDHQQDAAELVPGQEILVVGDWDGNDVRAQHIQVNPTNKGLGRVDQVLLEGYIHSLKGNQLNLGHGTLTLNPDVQVIGGSASQLSVNKRVQVSGRLADDRSVRVDRIEFSRGSPGSRSQNGDDERHSGSGDNNESSSDSRRSDGSGNSGDSERSGDSGSSGKTGSAKSSESSTESGKSGSTSDSSGSGRSESRSGEK